MQPYIPGGINDGKWHQVTVHFLNRVSLHIIANLFFDEKVFLTYMSRFWPNLTAKETTVGVTTSNGSSSFAGLV